MKIREKDNNTYFSSQHGSICHEVRDSNGRTLYFYEESISKHLNNYFERNRIDESNWGRLLDHNKNGLIIISACRGNYSEIENNKRTDKLAKDIRSKNYGYIPVLGGYIENKGRENEREVTERSFIVPKPSNISDKEFFDFAIDLCKKYNQDSVLISLPDYCDFGYYNKNGDFDFSPGKNMVFSDDKIGEYFSQLVKGNRKNKKFAYTEWLAIRRAGSVPDKVYMSKYKEDIHLK